MDLRTTRSMVPNFKLVEVLYRDKGLFAACKNSTSVIPIFVFTPEQVTTNEFKSSNCVQFMVESLKDLQNQMNGNLNLLYGNIFEVLNDILRLVFKVTKS